MMPSSGFQFWNPDYQSRMNPAGVAQRPAPDVAGGGMQAPTQTQQAPGVKESFLQRQRRLYPGGAPTGQPVQESPASQAGAVQNGMSPVQSNGRLAPPQPRQPMQMPQYVAPKTYGLDRDQASMLKGLVANPHTMTEDAVQAILGRQREDAALMEQQMNDAQQQQFAGRGIAGGGAAQAAARGSKEALISQLLRNTQDMRLQQLQQNRADELGVNAALGDFLDRSTSRQATNFGAGLSGAQAQAGERFNWEQLNQQRDLTNRQIDSSDSQFSRQLSQRAGEFDTDQAYKYALLQADRDNRMMDWLMMTGGR